MTPWLSLLIPLRNEADHGFALLEQVTGQPGVEVILVEGFSVDATWELLQPWGQKPGVRLLQVPAPRSSQLHQGALAAQGDFLLFLHADSRLEPGWLEAVQAFTLQSQAVAGAFSLRLEGGLALACYAWFASLRARWFGLPYGDQGLFLSRLTYFKAGGFPQLPLMEDFALSRLLHRFGPIQILPLGIWTSNRRYLRLGLWRSFWFNQWMVWGFFRGKDLEQLRLQYQSVKLTPQAPAKKSP